MAPPPGATSHILFLHFFARDILPMTDDATPLSQMDAMLLPHLGALHASVTVLQVQDAALLPQLHALHSTVTALQVQMSTLKQLATDLLISSVRSMSVIGIVAACSAASPEMRAAVRMPESGLSPTEHLLTMPDSARRATCLRELALH